MYLSERPDYQIGGRYAHVFENGIAELLVVKAALGTQQEFGFHVDAETKSMTLPGLRSGFQRFDSVRAGPHRPHRSGVGESGLNASVMHVVYEKRQLYTAYLLHVELAIPAPEPELVSRSPSSSFFAASPPPSPSPDRSRSRRGRSRSRSRDRNRARGRSSGSRSRGRSRDRRR